LPPEETIAPIAFPDDEMVIAQGFAPQPNSAV